MNILDEPEDSTAEAEAGVRDRLLSPGRVRRARNVVFDSIGVQPASLPECAATTSMSAPEHNLHCAELCTSAAKFTMLAWKFLVSTNDHLRLVLDQIHIAVLPSAPPKYGERRSASGHWPQVLRLLPDGILKRTDTWSRSASTSLTQRMLRVRLTEAAARCGQKIPEKTSRHEPLPA